MAEVSVVDYIIFALMLAISAGIGIFYGCFGKKNTTAKEMLVANRQMTVFPTAMSLLASFMSGITILGNPAESYNYGTMFVWAGVAHIMVAIVVANVFIPLYHQLEITSTYEYLEKRFDRHVKLMASIIFIIQMTIYMALVLYAPALALAQVTGINLWILVVSIGVICTFYTTIGGMKAVMWTDVFQIIMMFVGLLASLIKGTTDNGGIDNVVETCWKGKRLELFDFDPNPTTRHTVWSLTIGFFFQWLYIYGVNQSQVQRYISVPNAKTAKKALYWNLLGLIFILTVSLGVGLVIYTKYYDCDPLLAKRIEISEQLYPLFVFETLNTTPGLPGLFLACLFSAALSTISSGLNSLVAVMLEDVVKGFIVKNMSEKRELLLSKILCIAFGILCLILTYLASFLGALLQAALSLFGVIGGPVLGLFILGIFFPFANSKGAIAGTLSSMAFTVWIFVGSAAYGIKYPKKPMSIAGCNKTIENFNMTMPDLTIKERYGLELFHSISYTWYGFLAVAVVLIVGITVSLLTGRNDPNKVDTTLMIPFFSRYFSWLPKKFLKLTECGYTFRRASTVSIIHENELKPKLSSNTQKVSPLANYEEILEEPRNVQDFGKNNPAFSEPNLAVTEF